MIHLGHEYDGVSPHLAEIYLREGKAVTMVGIGDSMYPKILSHSRMIIEPFQGQPRPGDAIFVKSRLGYHTLHLCLYSKKRKFLMGDTWGGIHGWFLCKNVLGRYAGDYGTLPWDSELLHPDVVGKIITPDIWEAWANWPELVGYEH